MTFRFGTDPEIFLRKNGKPLSAHGVIPGTKSEPFPVMNGGIQVDGLAVELNTEPADNFETFNNNITTVIRQLREKVREKEPDATFSLVPVQEFGQEYLDTQPEEAKMLGCDPDWNAYTKALNPTPDGTRTFRTAAGHLHIGWGADIPVESPEHIDICASFVKRLDDTVGMFMTILDKNPLRRELYGQAGAFRPKSYGVEYRTPSNMWLRHKDYRRAIFLLMQLAIRLERDGRPNGNAVSHAFNPGAPTTQTIINEGHVDCAKKVLFYFTENYYRTEHTFFCNVVAKAEAEKE